MKATIKMGKNGFQIISEKGRQRASDIREARQKAWDLADNIAIEYT